MSQQSTNIPLPVAPLNGPDGRISEIWWRFFLELFNRTGGTTGNVDTVDPVYSDILASLMSSGSDTPLPDLTFPMFPASDNQNLTDALFVVPAPDAALQEMIYAPTLAENTNVSFISVTYSGQLTSTVATGTAPIVVSSTTKVINLNADLLDGGDWSAPGAIGATTPNTGVFTAVNSTGVGSSTFGATTTNTGVNFVGSNSGAAGGTFWSLKNGATTIIAAGNKSSLLGTAYDATPYISANAQIEFSQNIKVPGGAQFLTTTGALTNGAGAGAGTITNAPAAGNPTKWIGINDNGTIRYIPSW